MTSEVGRPNGDNDKLVFVVVEKGFHVLLVLWLKIIYPAFCGILYISCEMNSEKHTALFHFEKYNRGLD